MSEIDREKEQAELNDDELDEVAGGAGVHVLGRRGAQELHEGGGFDPLGKGNPANPDMRR